MFEAVLEELLAAASLTSLFELGGGVLLAIAALLLVMWVLILERLLYLLWTHPVAARLAQSRWDRRTEHHSWYALRIRERLLSSVNIGLERNMRVIAACVTLCPLLGLLGTVTGMINVFEALTLFGSADVRSLAAGVARATIPTLAGMVAALSGLAMHTWLGARVRREHGLTAAQLSVDR